MHESFIKYTDKLPVLLNMLTEMHPVNPVSLPKSIPPQRGIYLFSDKNVHQYVGRSNNIRRRINHHCGRSSKKNHATFAFRIARSKTKFKNATYKPEG